MTKALCISSAIAMAFAAASAQSAQSECNRLSAGPARTACMSSNIRSEGVDASTVGRAIGHGTARPGAAAEAGAAISSDAAAQSSAAAAAPAVGGTSGAAAQGAGIAVGAEAAGNAVHGAERK